MPDRTKFRSAFAFAVLSQMAVIALAGMMLDFGDSLRVAVIAAIAFWAGTWMVMRRHKATPGDFALAYVRVGYWVLVLVSAVVVNVVWHFLGST